MGKPEENKELEELRAKCHDSPEAHDAFVKCVMDDIIKDLEKKMEDAMAAQGLAFND